MVIASKVSSWYPHSNGGLRLYFGNCDLGQKKSEQEWKREWLSCQATFVRLERHEDSFWRAGKEREIIGASYDTRYYTSALPQLLPHCSVNLRLERIRFSFEGVLLLALVGLMFLFGSLLLVVVGGVGVLPPNVFTLL